MSPTDGRPSSPADAEVPQRLAGVRERIRVAAERAGRDPEAVTLIGVAKRQPPTRVAAAVRAGLRNVAENFAQEARDKIPQVEALLAESGTAAPRWHFVGRLQRNKARLVAARFDCVHSVDRIELARELDRRAGGRERPLRGLLQVNVSGEPQKGGVEPEALAALLEACAPLAALRIVGLMCVPAAAPDPEAARAAFARLRGLRDAHREKPGGEALRELSMGMSADFEVAVEEGATWVRVGTAIFGARPG